MSSNYPPGVTGSEWQIAGPSPAWERMYERVHDALAELLESVGAEPSVEVFTDLLDRIVSVVEESPSKGDV